MSDLISNFVSNCQFQSGYCGIMKRDWAKEGRKNPTAFAQRVLSHTYGDYAAKALRDLVRANVVVEMEEAA